MRLHRGLIFLACICCAVPGFTAERSEAWLPVTAQDLQVKEVPGDPGAAAIQLYYADFIDHKKKTEFIYKRIKVLTSKGLEHANKGEICLVNSIAVSPLWGFVSVLLRSS